MKQRGTAIFGNRGTGKSNLVKLLVRQLLRNNVTVKIFDPTQTHTKQSDVEHYQILRNQNLFEIETNPEMNIIYDTSRLYPQEQKLVIAGVIANTFEHASEIGRNNWICFVIEECQMVLGTTELRSRMGQEALRWVTTSRNFKGTYIIAGQRPSMIATTAISLTGARYFGQLDEPNDLAKLKKFIRDKEIMAKVPDLKTGEFVVKMSQPKIVKTPLFQPIRQPQPYEKPKIPFWRRLFACW